MHESLTMQQIRHVTYVPNGKLLIYSNKKNSPESKQIGTVVEQRIAPKYKSNWLLYVVMIG